MEIGLPAGELALLISALLVAGLVAGFLAGLLGIGGGGVLVRLGSRVALDLGSQYFTTQYDIVGGASRTAGYVLARLGLSVGL